MMKAKHVSRASYPVRIIRVHQPSIPTIHTIKRARSVDCRIPSVSIDTKKNVIYSINYLNFLGS